MGRRCWELGHVQLLGGGGGLRRSGERFPDLRAVSGGRDETPFRKKKSAPASLLTLLTLFHHVSCKICEYYLRH